MNKKLLYQMATAMMGMADAAEHRNRSRSLFHEQTKYRHMPDEPPPPKRTCKDCYFYTGSTYCKRVKHHINKFTPANGCAYFKKK